MKRLVTVITITVVLVTLAATGCTNKELVTTSLEAGEAAINTCVTCHTDKETLKELATVEEIVESESTTGEG